MTLKNLYLLLFVLFTACQQSETKTDSETITSETNLIDLFPMIVDSTYIVNIDENTIENEFLAKDCIPLIYQPSFEGLIMARNSTSTGLKPIGKMELDNGNYWLMVTQKEDYGGVAYGLTFDGESNKITQKEVIAELQGDAGDLSLMQSYIEQTIDGLLISKTIQVFNSDIETKGEEVVITNETSWDSVAVISVQQDLIIEEITTYRETK